MTLLFRFNEIVDDEVEFLDYLRTQDILDSVATGSSLVKLEKIQEDLLFTDKAFIFLCSKKPEHTKSYTDQYNQAIQSITERILKLRLPNVRSLKS